MLSEGEVVGRFVVDRLIGRGAMASVYRVHEPRDGTPYALKVLDLTGPQTAERFAREAQVQAALRHPNVVAFVEVLTVGGAPALVMEFVDGLNLDQVLNREPLEYALLVRLFAEVCAGVEAAHATGIVHRDLKPANVLVGEVRGLRVAKVSDFGLVKVAAEGDRSLTQGNVRLGTPGFMAPEQAFDPRDVDARADLFSLGCILYRMVTGQLAFPGETKEIFANLSAGRWTDPRVHVPDLPEHYFRAINACLQPDRELRPASVAALRELLRPAAPPPPDSLANALADLARMLAPTRTPPSPAVTPEIGAPPLPPAVRSVIPFAPTPEPTVPAKPPAIPPATRTVTPFTPPPVVKADAAKPTLPKLPPATRTVTPLEALAAAPVPVPPVTHKRAPVGWIVAVVLLGVFGIGGFAVLAAMAYLAWTFSTWPRFG